MLTQLLWLLIKIKWHRLQIVKTNNDNHQAVYLSLQPFISVNVENLGFRAETPLPFGGRTCQHVQHTARCFAFFRSVLETGFISPCATLIDLSLLFTYWFFFWVSTLLLSDHGNHTLDIFEDRTFTQYKHFFLENGWGNRFYCVPWRSADLDPHQSMTDDNSRVTGLKNSIFFSRIVKFNGNEQSDGMGIMGSLGACAV